MSTLRRLLQLWRLYATLDILFITRSAGTAIPWYFSDIIIGLAAITTTFLLAERFGGIGPWSQAQVVFLLGYALTVRGSINTCSTTTWPTSAASIGRGQLDHMLIQPQPLWMALLTEGFVPVTGGAMLVPGVGLLVWSACAGARHLARLAGRCCWHNLVASIAVVMAFNYAWATLAFWAPRARRGDQPLDLEPADATAGVSTRGAAAVALGGLLTIVPVGLVAWLPSRALLGIEMPDWGLASCRWPALLLSWLAVAIFMRGLTHYGRTGSTRYLPWGHRS